MEEVQKIFKIELKTTDTNIDKFAIKAFLDQAIENSPYAGTLTFKVEENVYLAFNFLNDPMVFSLFIRKTKEDFLEEYPYHEQAYDFCLSEFNKHREEALIDFLENTRTKELTEPYKLSPEDFSFCVGQYIKNNMTHEEQLEFLKLTTSKGLKVEIY